MLRGAGMVGAALALTALAPASRAAEIRKLVTKDLSAIVVMGQILDGDQARFADIALTMPNAVVVLDSPGGNLVAGIEIGRAIHLKGYATTVAKGDTCASACAIAWLGGRKRSLFPGARVGFHAAYYKDAAGKTVTASVGNALAGAYLNQIGLPDRAIVFITTKPPEDIAWLTQGDAARNGIEMTQIEEGGGSSRAASPTPTASVSPASPTPQRRPENWTGYGEWVQVASRRQLSEATEFARETSRRNANTNVFRYANGWYGVVIGPFSPGRGDFALDALIRSDEAPHDSLLVRGDRFTSLEWGPIPERKGSASAAASVNLEDPADGEDE